MLTGKSTTDFAIGIRAPEIETKGILYNPIEFDGGDPLGEYKIEIFINNTLKKTIIFNVISEKIK